MRQKEVLQKLSKEIRELHNITIEKHTFHYHGNEMEAYIGFPTSLIEGIEETDVVIRLNLGAGVLTLWKDHPSAHLTLFDRKAQNRKIARERRERRKKGGEKPDG